MKVAILADVHGNLPALEAILDDLSRQDVDRVVVNGDLVNRGPASVEVVERLFSSGFECTLGNHDDLMRKWVQRDDLPSTWFEDPFWRATGWCAERLAAAGWIAPLTSLPMSIRIAPGEGPTLLISHGSPRHYREGYGRHLTDAAVREIVETYDGDVLVGSHTHRPMQRASGRVAVFNTGAVGTPFNGDTRAQYLILELQQGRWEPEFRAVTYDRDAALEAFETSGFLSEGGLSARIFYFELLFARAYLMPFLKWTETHGRVRDDDAWDEFRELFAERFQHVDPKVVAAAGVRGATGT